MFEELGDEWDAAGYHWRLLLNRQFFSIKYSIVKGRQSVAGLHQLRSPCNIILLSARWMDG